MKAILAKKIKPGDVVVIRYEGPKGGPGMQEMLAPTSALIGQASAILWGFSPTGAFPAAPGRYFSADGGETPPLRRLHCDAYVFDPINLATPPSPSK